MIARIVIAACLTMPCFEGARHGIAVNTVLPTGFSRMVTENAGDSSSPFYDAIDPDLVCRWWSIWPAALVR
jgi:hypothetical protein